MCSVFNLYIKRVCVYRVVIIENIKILLAHPIFFTDRNKTCVNTVFLQNFGSANELTDIRSACVTESGI